MNKKHIFWAGDSTVKTNDFSTYPQTGIGQAMPLFLGKDVVVHNHAENGRSTKSFIDESRLAVIYNELREGDFLFIQFGHNDAKEEDASRFTKPYGDYQVNLEKYINVARNRKAYPVLITPLCRRWFLDETTLEENKHGQYPEAMKEVARKMKVPIIDLFTMSKTFIENLGETKSKEYFVEVDNTHLRYPGAVAFADLIAHGLYQLGGLYKELLNEAYDDEKRV